MVVSVQDEVAVVLHSELLAEAATKLVLEALHGGQIVKYLGAHLALGVGLLDVEAANPAVECCGLLLREVREALADATDGAIPVGSGARLEGIQVLGGRSATRR